MRSHISVAQLEFIHCVAPGLIFISLTWGHMRRHSLAICNTASATGCDFCPQWKSWEIPVSVLIGSPQSINSGKLHQNLLVSLTRKRKGALMRLNWLRGNKKIAHRYSLHDLEVLLILRRSSTAVVRTSFSILPQLLHYLSVSNKLGQFQFPFSTFKSKVYDWERLTSVAAARLPVSHPVCCSVLSADAQEQGRVCSPIVRCKLTSLFTFWISTYWFLSCVKPCRELRTRPRYTPIFGWTQRRFLFFSCHRWGY